MMASLISQEFGRYLNVCLNYKECRGPNGVRRTAGLMIIGILLATCARCESQRSQARWFKTEWSWILEAWEKAGGKSPSTLKPPRQSDISRFQKVIPASEFNSIIDAEERRAAATELKASNDRGIIHLSADGKARKGCVDSETGRTEVDLTLLETSSGRVVAAVSLETKEGEKTALKKILSEKHEEFKGAVLTTDAGMTSILKETAIADAEMEALIQIKGNSGEVYKEVKSMDWDRVKTKTTDLSKGHGRKEHRTTRVIDLNFVENEIQDKYPSIECAVELEKWCKNTKTGAVSHSFRYYLGTAMISRILPKQVHTIIRDHWKIETYHYVKDVNLGEDRSLTVSSNASKFTARIRGMIARMGKVYGSTKILLEDFSRRPESTLYS